MKVPARRHWHLFCLATTWWTLFYLVGMPSRYFQTWPLVPVVLFGIVMPLAALTYYMRARIRRHPERAGTEATAIAFHMTVPLFIYDWWVLAVNADLGMGFLASHWYLTVFYVLPWIVAALLVSLRRSSG